jgi:hypothetical protein
MRFAVLGLGVAAVAVAQLQDLPVGCVDFYALGGLDSQKLRSALTIRAGDKFKWPGTRDQIREELTKAAGRPFTHFAPVCCDTQGRLMIYVGFGDTSASSSLRPKPARDVNLPQELTSLYEHFLAMLPESLKHAAGTAEDYSKGYSLASYPPMRTIQLRMREVALAHEDDIFAVIHDGRDDKQRAVAAHFAGYVRQSPRQIAALVEASRDYNATVRNNATRALGVLADSPETARRIPASPFVETLNSPVWSDRNKGLMLLTRLTRDRDPGVLAELRAKALPALIEMAQWQNPGHSEGAILLLGRIAGMDAAKLAELAAEGSAEPVLAAIRRLN